jgi:hypothetical protein
VRLKAHHFTAEGNVHEITASQETRWTILPPSAGIFGGCESGDNAPLPGGSQTWGKTLYLQTAPLDSSGVVDRWVYIVEGADFGLFTPDLMCSPWFAQGDHTGETKIGASAWTVDGSSWRGWLSNVQIMAYGLYSDGAPACEIAYGHDYSSDPPNRLLLDSPGKLILPEPVASLKITPESGVTFALSYGCLTFDKSAFS